MKGGGLNWLRRCQRNLQRTAQMDRSLSFTLLGGQLFWSRDYHIYFLRDQLGIPAEIAGALLRYLPRGRVDNNVIDGGVEAAASPELLDYAEQIARIANIRVRDIEFDHGHYYVDRSPRVLYDHLDGWLAYSEDLADQRQVYDFIAQYLPHILPAVRPLFLHLGENR